MTKKVSMQQIADRLGLSKYAVSRALSGKPGVSEETQQKILEMAHALGYKPKSGVSTSTVRTSSENSQKPFVLIWTQPTTNKNETFFWNRVLAGIINGCEDADWDHLIVSRTSDDGDFVFPSFADRTACVGIIVVGKWHTSLLLSMKKLGFPIILVEHEDPLSDLDCVINGSFDAARTMCKKIISDGCRSIIYIGVEQHSVSFDERWRGCQTTVDEEKELGRNPVSLTKWSLPLYGLKPLEQKAISQIEEGLPDCFVCANDDLALMLINTLKKAGCSVPEQCKVVGFDNIERSAYSDPPLTTVDVYKEVLGYRAVEALQRRAAKPGMPKEKIILSTHLIVRKSG